MNHVRTDGAASMSLSQLVPDTHAAACLTEPTARRLNVVPLYLLRNNRLDTLMVGSSQPDSDKLKERLARQLPDTVRAQFLHVDARAIPDALNRCYKTLMSVDDVLACCSVTDQQQQGGEPLLPDVAISLVEALLQEACRHRATDIHVSPLTVSDDAGVLVRFRIDGVLKPFVTLRSDLYSGLLVRIKILADIDIAETRHPQDGQFVLWIAGHDVDFRVSSFPTITGENLVLRVMNQQSSLASLEQLKLPATIVRQFDIVLARPEGMVIVCGPTGSGKTTTLYALLNELDESSLNIMTLEDPVEIRSPSFRQTSIHPDRTLDYAHGLRAMLRQDPDVLMIGEVRDSESCHMLLRAVMTGHRVFSTVHANSALGAVDRLLELGIQRSMLVSHLAAVASQRLVRLICNHCSGRQAGCVDCKGTGYVGRRVIMELLIMDAHLAALLSSGASAQQVTEHAVSIGFNPLREQGLDLIRQGLTTAEELQRVLGMPAVAEDNSGPVADAVNSLP